MIHFLKAAWLGFTSQCNNRERVPKLNSMCKKLAIGRDNIDSSTFCGQITIANLIFEEGYYSFLSTLCESFQEKISGPFLMYRHEKGILALHMYILQVRSYKDK